MLVDKTNKNYIKNENPYRRYKEKTNNDILKLYYQYNHLKNIYRQGWLTNLIGKEHPERIESIADHSWSVTMLALSIIEKYKLDYNIEKCMKLALIHELGEIYAGDYTPNSITKEEKHKLEEQAVEKLLEDVKFENDFKQLWLEYENEASTEAEFIKQVDKLECIMQASCYGLNTKFMLGESKISIPCLKEIIQELKIITQSNEIPLCMRKKDQEDR